MTPDAHTDDHMRDDHMHDDHMRTPVSITPDGAKIPVVATVLDAFQDVWTHRGAALRITAAWGGLLAIAGLVSFAMIVGAQSTLDMSPWVNLVAVRLPWLLYFLLLLSVAVGWHRRVLLNEEPSRVYLRFDRTVWRYIGASLWMGLAIGLVSAVFLVPAFLLIGPILGTDPSQWTASGIALAAVIGVVAYIPALVCALRMAIALPARAVGDRMKLREALALTKGNTWRILAASLLISVPLIVVQAVMNLLLGFQLRMPGGELNWWSITSFLALMALALAALIALTLVSVGYLSLVYRFFAERRMQAPTMAATA